LDVRLRGRRLRADWALKRGTRADATRRSPRRAQSNQVVDYGLAVVAPLHGHCAMNYVRRPLPRSRALTPHARCHAAPRSPRAVLTWTGLRSRRQVISDYVPVASRGVARLGMLGATLVATLGLVKLTRDGPGPTAALKSLWRK